MQRLRTWTWVAILSVFLVTSTVFAKSLSPHAAKKTVHKLSAVKHKVKHSRYHKKIVHARGPVGKSRRTLARVHTVKAGKHHVRSSATRLAARQGSHHPAARHVAYQPILKSSVALVIDRQSGKVLYEKNADEAFPIASLTKLMTALVVVESQQRMDEMLQVTTADIDRIKHTGSRLRIGARLTRADMLHIALMSSENRAASALGRNYPGGLPAFVKAMNEKAKALGMLDTHYVEPTGLSSDNVSSARDLAKLVIAAHRYLIIRQYSTNASYRVNTGKGILLYRNSNKLIARPNWKIELQKTGYISEAGRCLVMHTLIKTRPVVMVFLNGQGKHSRVHDAGATRQWLTESKLPDLIRVSAAEAG